MTKLLDPSLGSARVRGAIAERPDTLDNKVLGVIWNSRPYGDKILKMTLDVLAEKYKFKEVVFLRKPYLGNVAPTEIFDELVGRGVNVAITGVGD